MKTVEIRKNQWNRKAIKMLRKFIFWYLKCLVHIKFISTSSKRGRGKEEINVASEQKIFHLKITANALYYTVDPWQLVCVRARMFSRRYSCVVENYMKLARNYIENYKLVISLDCTFYSTRKKKNVYGTARERKWLRERERERTNGKSCITKDHTHSK